MTSIRHIVFDIGNVLIRWLMTCPVSDAASNFTAFRSTYARELSLVENDHRYVIPIFVRRGMDPKRIGEIVQRHPEEAVSIVRNWMYQES